MAYGGLDHIHEVVMRDGCCVWVLYLQLGIRVVYNNTQLALDEFGCGPPFLEDAFVVSNIRERLLFLNGFEGYISIVVQSRNRLTKVQAAEEIKVFCCAKISVSSMISAKQHGSDPSQGGFPNPRLSH